MLHTPGHSPGARLPVRAGRSACVFTGDTLFQGGPGATGRSFSRPPDDPRSRSGSGCSTLPDDTVVHTGHGDDTTIGAERDNVK